MCEKGDSLGGLVKLAAVPIAKQELTKVIQYMERKLIREGVEIRLNCEVTEEMLKNEFAGYEVIAGTGADQL